MTHGILIIYTIHIFLTVWRVLTINEHVLSCNRDYSTLLFYNVKYMYNRNRHVPTKSSNIYF